MNKNDLILYIASLLNLDTTPTYIYMDMSDELEAVKDYNSFRKEFKELLGSLKQQLEYKTAFQKFQIVMETLNNKKLELNPVENNETNKWIDHLYRKLTWYFDELAWDKPTGWQLDHHIWKDFTVGKEKEKKKFFNEKQITVCGMIGDTKELYRLSTQNKPLLQEKIKSNVLELIKQKKTGTVAIGYDNPVAKLMNKGK